MFIRVKLTQAVALVGVNLKLVGFARLDESLDKLICVRKVNILINHPLDDEQPILFIWEVVDIREDGAIAVTLRVNCGQIHVAFCVASVIEAP